MESMIGQFVGGVAFIIGTSAFLQKDDIKFRVLMALFCMLMAMHFYLIGAIIGAIGVSINAVRILVSIYSKSQLVMWAFIIALIGFSIPSVTHLMEVLPIAGSVVGTYALFRLQGLKMRGLILFNSLCWAIHNIWAGSIGGSLVEMAFVVSNIITITRLLAWQRTQII
ncbi:YgjV family protein [Vibrio aestuarianus]|uniref:YgjV family protein n=1 Tax=Vibrio aestuarianus TaxID=28171 RepID=A0AAX3U3A4_9VIBR|nr:YgjV family protein [Vibrio aestuarianus]WGK81384.1 YgjV family protein [Vibrio aestuarianus]